MESIVEVKGMLNKVTWTIVNYKPPTGMTLNGDGKGGVKIKLLAKVAPTDEAPRSASTCTWAGGVVRSDRHAGGRRAQE